MGKRLRGALGLLALGGLALVLALMLPSPRASASFLGLEASLDGPQALSTCPGGSPGTGSATINYDTVTNVFAWDITFSGLSGAVSVAHFHGPAAPGVDAGIQVTITDTTSPSVGMATITDGQEADLLAGLWYANFHTMMCPNGEIRGQVLSSVGGIAEAPDIGGTSLATGDASGGNAGLIAAVAAAAAGAVAMGSAFWYARRRWLG